MPKLRITHTIVHVYEVEYDEDHYRDMSLKEAAQYERDVEVGDVIEMLTALDDDSIGLETEVEVIG